jgi:serine/threonine protein kinase
LVDSTSLDIRCVLLADADAPTTYVIQISSISSIMGSSSSHSSSFTSFTASPPLPAEQYYKETIDCLLGEGVASVVYRAFDSRANQHIAIKKIDYSSQDPFQPQSERAQRILFTALTELRVYKRLGDLQSTSTPLSPFIVQLQSAYALPSFSACYLIMSCLSTDLKRVLKLSGSGSALSEASVVYIVGCISSALNFLHHHGVIHRDVKPDNICLDQFGRPYLTNFGISALSSVSNPLPISNSTSGTLPYASPEALAPSNFHSYQSDYWSLGVTAYELYFCRLPFPRICPPDMMKFVANHYHWVWRELLSDCEESPSLPPLTCLDFSAIQNSDPSVEVPFPDFDLTLNEDGSLPESLVPGDLCGASELFKSLLCGLMDVRIPHRLGSMTRFSELSEHQIFLEHGWFPFSDLSSMVSPFAGAEYLNRKGSSSPQDLNISPPTQLDRKTFMKLLTPELKELLSQFQYFPSLPSSSAPLFASLGSILLESR